MRKNKILVISIYLLIAIHPMQTFSQNVETFFRNVEKYRHAIRLNKDYDDIDTSTFALKEYLALFDNIHIQKGYSLDFIYFDDPNGRPYIYAKPDSFELEKYLDAKTLKIIHVDTIVKTKKELVEIKQHTLQPVYEEVKKTEIHVDSQNYNCAYFHLLYKFLNDSVNRGYNHIVPNDHELGYFQYFYFEEYGEMFCGKWHQGYNYKSIIFDKEELKNLIKSYLSGDEHAFSKTELKQIKQLQSINPKPEIVMTENTCEISVVEEDFHGLFKRTFTVSRTFPHKMEITNEKVLVWFNEVLFF